MIHYKTGNLLEASADALVNTVNSVGVMGKGSLEVPTGLRGVRIVVRNPVNSKSKRLFHPISG